MKFLIPLLLLTTSAFANNETHKATALRELSSIQNLESQQAELMSRPLGYVNRMKPHLEKQLKAIDNLLSSGHLNGNEKALKQVQALREMQMSFNLQYLQLQSQMQAENRSYTAISSVMKTKRDTVKNSIGNVR